jgi:hypothetical protein
MVNIETSTVGNTPTLADLLKQLEAVFERARRRPVLPAQQIPQARAMALEVVRKLPEGRAIAYLLTRALPAFAAVADASEAMLGRRIQELPASVMEKDPHAGAAAAAASFSHAAAQRDKSVSAAKARDLHTHLSMRGIRLEATKSGGINVTPAALLSADESAKIVECKAELTTLLTSTTTL